MKIYGMCNFELKIHELAINMDTVVVDLNCQTILGMDILGNATKLPYPVTSFPHSNGMLCGNGGHYKHSTTFRSDTVGETKN